jgi:phosphate:Na+ symporter
MILGFSLLFISLELVKTYTPEITDSWLKDFVLYINSFGYLSYLIYFALGTLFTIIFRSSNAIFAVILVLSIKGWLPFAMGAAMILGVNVGTTISAITAARIANITAKRAALVHLLFKVFGVLWMIPVFPFFIKGIASLYTLFGGDSPFNHVSGIPVSLALFHTLFNVLNTVILFSFSKQITKIVTKRIPVGSSPEMSLNLPTLKWVCFLLLMLQSIRLKEKHWFFLKTPVRCSETLKR